VFILSFVVVKQKEDVIDVLLKKYGMTRKDLKCAICGMDLSDLRHLGAVFPYASLLVCCDKFDCIYACRNKLLLKED